MNTPLSTSRLHRIATVLVLGVLLTSVLGSAQTVHAIVNIRFVSPGGLSVGLCNSWANACNLQYAISLAFSGNQVWVREGTYKPLGDRNDSFTLKNGVGIYGGFVGTETLLSQRDPDAHVTILSGDIGITGDVTDNSYHVVVGSGTDNTALLDGFIVTAGNADEALGNASGGGVVIENGGATLANLTVTGNTALQGGGMAIVTASPTLTNLTVSGNSASIRGGGMYTYTSSPNLNNVTFSGNDSGADGGGMYNNTGSNPILTNVTLSGNTAGSNGGGMYNDSSSPSLTNVTFSGNTADGDGGGMYNHGSSPYLTNVALSGNGAAYGGGMYNFSGSYPLIRNATFSGNTASLGGAMLNLDSSAPAIWNSVFWNSGDEIYDADVLSIATLKDDIVAGGCPTYAICTNVLNLNPLLQPLADNGGFTQTMALNALSPAKDAGGVNEPCAATDQRGILRPQGPACDMGSYEYDGVETTLTYRSVGTQDGWVLESTETSGSGGSLDAAATQFNLGDDASNRQYRGILSFDTSSLPDGAVITAVTLKIKKTGLVGANPFSSLGDIIVDIKNGSFSSNSALQKTDFKALATKNYVAKFLNAPVSNWYSTALGASSFGYVNNTGTTQFRLRFATDDNNNLLANYLRFGSGNAVTTSRPQLIITYWP